MGDIFMINFTEHNKNAVLEALRTATTVREACKVAGIPLDTFNHWLSRAKYGLPVYTEFKKKVEEIKEANPKIKGKAWDRKRKYTLTYKGETGSLAQLAKKYALRYNVVYMRYMKHLAEPKSYPLTYVFGQPQDNMKGDSLQRDIAKSLASIANSLERIADSFEQG